MLRRAVALARWATRITALLAAAYPVALRERSLVLAACGQMKQALRYADKGCTVAEAQRAKYEHAQTLLVRGKIARQLGRPEAEKQICTAEAAIDAIERPLADAVRRASVLS